MKIEVRKIDDLKNWENNPRDCSSEAFERLKKQIQELQPYKPLLVTEEGIVLGGNMRLRAFKELGIKEIECSVVDAPSEEMKLKYALSDNDQVGRTNSEMIANLVGSIPDIDLSGYAIHLDEPTSIEDLLDSFKEVTEDEAPPVEEGEAVSKYGEVYQLGRHRLMCGDSTKIEDVERLMGGEKARLIFTDPPYNVNYDYDFRTSVHKGKKVPHHFFNDSREDEDFLKFLRDTFKNAYLFTSDDASFYVWHADKTARLFWQALEETGFYVSQRITWVKDHFVLAMGQHFHRMFEPCLHGWKKGKTPFYNKKVSSWSDVWNLDKKELLEEMDLWKLDRDAQIKYQHPTQKPVSLCKRALIKSSRVGDIVVDFFAGSGSTLIGCEQMDRVCYTLEIDPLYCDVVRKRYSNFIGKGAEWQKTTPLISN